MAFGFLINQFLIMQHGVVLIKFRYHLLSSIL
jgi:hypothetical protein